MSRRESIVYLRPTERLIVFRCSSTPHMSRNLVSAECNLHWALLITLTDQNHEHVRGRVLGIHAKTFNPIFINYGKYKLVKGERKMSCVYTCDQPSWTNSREIKTQQCSKRKSFPSFCLRCEADLIKFSLFFRHTKKRTEFQIRNFTKHWNELTNCVCWDAHAIVSKPSDKKLKFALLFAKMAWECSINEPISTLRHAKQ